MVKTEYFIFVYAVFNREKLYKVTHTHIHIHTLLENVEAIFCARITPIRSQNTPYKARRSFDCFPLFNNPNTFLKDFFFFFFLHLQKPEMETPREPIIEGSDQKQSPLFLFLFVVVVKTLITVGHHASGLHAVRHLA